MAADQGHSHSGTTAAPPAAKRQRLSFDVNRGRFNAVVSFKPNVRLALADAERRQQGYQAVNPYAIPLSTRRSEDIQTGSQPTLAPASASASPPPPVQQHIDPMELTEERSSANEHNHAAASANGSSNSDQRIPIPLSSIYSMWSAPGEHRLQAFMDTRKAESTLTRRKSFECRFADVKASAAEPQGSVNNTDQRVCVGTTFRSPMPLGFPGPNIFTIHADHDLTSISCLLFHLAYTSALRLMDLSTSSGQQPRKQPCIIMITPATYELQRIPLSPQGLVFDERALSLIQLKSCQDIRELKLLLAGVHLLSKTPAVVIIDRIDDFAMKYAPCT